MSETSELRVLVPIVNSTREVIKRAQAGSPADVGELASRLDGLGALHGPAQTIEGQLRKAFAELRAGRPSEALAFIPAERDAPTPFYRDVRQAITAARSGIAPETGRIRARLEEAIAEGEVLTAQAAEMGIEVPPEAARLRSAMDEYVRAVGLIDAGRLDEADEALGNAVRVAGDNRR